MHRHEELFYQQLDGLQVFASYGVRGMLRRPLVLRNLRCSGEVHRASGLGLHAPLYFLSVSGVDELRSRNKDLRETTLFLNYTAGDAIAGVAGGVGHEIVFPGVDDK